MNILPEWAPHIHPLLVHFPIALLFAGAGVDVLALILKRDSRLRFVAVALYGMGTLGALASFFSGRSAADAVLLPAAANPILTEHADWAMMLVWFFGIYSLVRITDLWRNEQPGPVLWWPLTLLGIAGLFLVYQTGERGGQMVFEHGVGVLAVNEAPAPKLVVSGTDALNVVQGEGWTWKPVSPSRWDKGLVWLAGNTASVKASGVGSKEDEDVLALELSGGSVFFVVEEPLQNVQIDLGIQLDAFDGVLTVVHNLEDTQNFMYMELTGEIMQQGSVQDGADMIHDKNTFVTQGWQQIRVVADRTHFRAYGGQRMITHGHGDAPEAGTIGIRIDGTGMVLLDHIQVQSIEH